MNCINCDARISARYNYCPNCGEPLKETRQQRMLRELLKNTEILHDTFTPLDIKLESFNWVCDSIYTEFLGNIVSLNPERTSKYKNVINICVDIFDKDSRIIQGGEAYTIWPGQFLSGIHTGSCQYDNKDLKNAAKAKVYIKLENNWMGMNIKDE